MDVLSKSHSHDYSPSEIFGNISIISEYFDNDLEESDYHNEVVLESDMQVFFFCFKNICIPCSEEVDILLFFNF